MYKFEYVFRSKIMIRVEPEFTLLKLVNGIMFSEMMMYTTLAFTIDA
jgi:hypothetical protein